MYFLEYITFLYMVDWFHIIIIKKMKLYSLTFTSENLFIEKPNLLMKWYFRYNVIQ